MKKSIKIVLISTGLLILIAGLYMFWRAIAPTTVAFVNFRDWQVAEFIDASQSNFIKIKRIDIRDGSTPDFTDYDVTILFGMGLKLTDDQKEAVRTASQEGTKFYVYASSSQESDLTNLRGKKLKKVRAYLSNGGKENLQQFLNYCRRELHGKKLFASEPKEPVKTPWDYYFAPDTLKKFVSKPAYDSAAFASGRFKEGRPKVLIYTSNVNPENESTARPFMALMKALEKRGINVYGAAGFRKRLEVIDEVKPQCILLFAHGRLAPGRGDSALAMLKK